MQARQDGRGQWHRKVRTDGAAGGVGGGVVLPGALSQSDSAVHFVVIVMMLLDIWIKGSVIMSTSANWINVGDPIQ